jgi:predicted transcriptional regulator
MFNTVQHIMRKQATMGLRVQHDLKEAVSRMSELSGMTASAITEEALREYIRCRTPQLLDLKEAEAAADRGEFATDEQVVAVFARYGA